TLYPCGRAIGGVASAFRPKLIADLLELRKIVVNQLRNLQTHPEFSELVCSSYDQPITYLLSSPCHRLRREHRMADLEQLGIDHHRRKRPSCRGRCSLLGKAGGNSPAHEPSGRY